MEKGKLKILLKFIQSLLKTNKFLFSKQFSISNYNREGKGIFKWLMAIFMKETSKMEKGKFKILLKFIQSLLKTNKFLFSKQFSISNYNREGKGIYKWADGDIYEGDFKNGESKFKILLKFIQSLLKTNKFLFSKQFSISNYNREGKGIFKLVNGRCL
jgi:Trm5-related predicted tRNA methylase